jgi:inner membrane protein
MIAATHAAFATGLYLGGSALFEYPAEPVGWGLAVFFSIVPDIDLPTSRIGRPLFWLSVRLERQHGHRTVTHSLVALLLVAGVASPLFAVGRGGWYWAILGGYWSHLWLDMLNIRGIDLFWPSTVRVVLPAPWPTGWKSAARPRWSCCRPWRVHEGIVFRWRRHGLCEDYVAVKVFSV